MYLTTFGFTTKLFGKRSYAKCTKQTHITTVTGKQVQEFGFVPVDRKSIYVTATCERLVEKNYILDESKTAEDKDFIWYKLCA